MNYLRNKFHISCSNGLLVSPSHMKLKKIFACPPCCHFTFQKIITVTPAEYSRRYVIIYDFRTLNIIRLSHKLLCLRYCFSICRLLKIMRLAHTLTLLKSDNFWFYRVLSIVYSTGNYWVFGPFSTVRCFFGSRNTTFRKLDLLPSSGEGGEDI
jgi:hypothetical protein